MAMKATDYDSPAERRRRYLQRLAALKSERESWVQHWRELSDYLLPRKGRFSLSDRNKGDRRNSKILDSTGTLAVRTLAAGMMSGITSPARPWFRLTTPDPDLMEFAPVKEWLFHVERRMREVFGRSNVYNALHAAYEELATFGTAAVLVDEDHRDVIRCYSFTAGEYALGTSARMNVNAFCREFTLTVGQTVERFGLESVRPQIRTQYEQGQVDGAVEILHVIAPNPRYREGRLGARGFPFTSCYLDLAGGDGKDFLSESGYQEFPVLAPRWDVTGADVYGRSPGMDALGDVKQLQQAQKRKAQGIDKMVDPPMVAPPALRNQPASVLPGGVTYVDTTQTGGVGFRPAYEVNPRLGELVQDIQETQGRIRAVFHADMFQMMVLSDRRTMTAREVEERHEEKLLLLGPVLERLHNELLDPLIDRTFSIMARNGLLPEAPQEIAGESLRVDYISILAQAQQAVGVGSIERLLGFVGNLAGMKPETIDKLDLDQAVDEYAGMIGAPPKMVVPDDLVEKRRQARAKLQAQQAQQEQTLAAVQGAKLLSETDTSGQNALTAALGA